MDASIPSRLLESFKVAYRFSRHEALACSRPRLVEDLVDMIVSSRPVDEARLSVRTRAHCVVMVVVSTQGVSASRGDTVRRVLQIIRSSVEMIDRDRQARPCLHAVIISLSAANGIRRDLVLAKNIIRFLRGVSRQGRNEYCVPSSRRTHNHTVKPAEHQRIEQY